MGETVRRVIVVNSSTEMENIESIDRVIASDPMLSSPVRKGGKRMASWTSKANWSLFGKWASRIHPWCDYCEEDETGKRPTHKFGLETTRTILERIGRILDSFEAIADPDPVIYGIDRS